jgi:Tol biopolymer transport system component
LTIQAGTRLGPYEVLAHVGAGGMGEVWRAKDTRLEREVAVKVLPPGLAENEQFRARFEREAKAISKLSHPHVCTLFDVGQEGELHFLVMEMLEGESLADRLKKGALPLEQVLKLGQQIASALDAAHRQGIVHRDLKPGNVMLTKSGAKLLDFGLARTASEGQAPLGGLSALATEAKPLTTEGTILGTFQYMAPEQLEGQEADARTDIFALGAVLYEMATGRRAFVGGSKTSLIAAIVSQQPAPISSVVSMAPPALDHVVRKCLEKDRDDRWQSAHDVASELLWISQAGSQAGVALGGTRRGMRRRAIASATLVTGVLIGAAGHWWFARQMAPSPHALQYVIEYGSLADSRPALAPDGSSIAYARDGVVHVRDLRRLEPVAIPGTEGGGVPFWSPDGAWLGFTADQKLWKIRLDGSGKTLLCSVAPGQVAGGAAWLPDGRIVFDTGRSGLYEVRDRGGDPRLILELRENEADFHFLSALPDGKGFLFVLHEGDRFDNITLWTGKERKTLLRLPGMTLGSPVYATSGHVLFDRSPQGRGVWALPFSLDRLEATGEPFPAAPLGVNPSVAGSTLVYAPVVPPILSEIVEVDRKGQAVRTIGAPRRGLYPSPALSPDGRLLVVPVVELTGSDLWLYDVASGEPARLTFHGNSEASAPAWTPDGSEIVYTWSSTSEDISLRAVKVDRSETRELGPGRGSIAFVGDGKSILYNLQSKGFNWNLWRKDVGDRSPGKALLSDPGWELHPALSPDGRFLAYDKDGDVLLRTFPGMGGPWQVATGGASKPRWSRDGGRLFFLSGNDMMEVSLHATTDLRIGTPKKLFTLAQAPVSPVDRPGFALGPGGETFIMVRPVERPPGLVVVQNWLALAGS